MLYIVITSLCLIPRTCSLRGMKLWTYAISSVYTVSLSSPDTTTCVKRGSTTDTLTSARCSRSPTCISDQRAPRGEDQAVDVDPLPAPINCPIPPPPHTALSSLFLHNENLHHHGVSPCPIHRHTEKHKEGSQRPLHSSSEPRLHKSCE
jgi:hypothetical protein